MIGRGIGQICRAFHPGILYDYQGLHGHDVCLDQLRTGKSGSNALSTVCSVKSFSEPKNGFGLAVLIDNNID